MVARRDSAMLHGTAMDGNQLVSREETILCGRYDRMADKYRVLRTSMRVRGSKARLGLYGG